MDSEEIRTNSLLESYFHHVYSQYLLKVYSSSLKEMCYGCVVDHPSQIQHLCEMWSEEEKVQFCFDDMIEKVDENVILRKWEEAVSNLECISPEILAAYKLKIFCDEWRSKEMKSPSWKEYMCDMVIHLIKLQRSFK